MIPFRAGSGATPPTAMVRDMLAAPAFPLPPPRSIAQTPVFAPAAPLQTRPGYRLAGRPFYDPAPDFAIPGAGSQFHCPRGCPA